MERILNLCDAGLRLCRKYSLEELTNFTGGCGRIYVGSYFCDRAFLSATREVIEKCLPYCLSNQIPLTCVLPIASQHSLAACKDMVLQLFRQYGAVLDTVCVNDPGMLAWFHDTLSREFQCRCILGRLFFKEIRDPRYDFTVHRHIYQISGETEDLIRRFGASGLEIEGLCEKVEKQDPDLDYTIYSHQGYCCISCGRYCIFASIPRDIEFKFRVDAACRLECSNFMIKNLLQEQKEVLRVGKGIYFKKEEPEKIPEGTDGIITLPLEKW